MKRNFHDGRTWMYQTQKEIAAIYPYWSRNQVQDKLQKLEDLGVIVKGNYNRTPLDRTAWYAFKDEKMFTKVRNRTIDCREENNGMCETPPLPYTNKIANPIEQQHTAVVLQENSLNQKQQQQTEKQPPGKAGQVKQKPTTHPCLQNLDIPQGTKERLTKEYSEETVQNAIYWVAANEDKIKTTYVATLIWACQAKPEMAKKQEDVFQDNKDYAVKHDGLEANSCRVDALSDCVAVVYLTSQKEPTAIKYTETRFKEKFKSLLQKVGIKSQE